MCPHIDRDEIVFSTSQAESSVTVSTHICRNLFDSRIASGVEIQALCHKFVKTATPKREKYEELKNCHLEYRINKN